MYLLKMYTDDEHGWSFSNDLIWKLMDIWERRGIYPTFALVGSMYFGLEIKW